MIDPYKLFFFLLGSTVLLSDVRTPPATLYQTINPNSLSQLSAFYLLHPDKVEGKKCLQQILHLVGQPSSTIPEVLCSLLLYLEGSSRNPERLLTFEELAALRVLFAPFPNKSLKEYGKYDVDSLEELSEKGFDLGSVLLMELFANEPECKRRQAVEHYNALLDLMALHILTQLPTGATDSEKIDAITHYLFHKQGFCFPPLNIFKEGRFSMLSVVIDQKRGVCLGVSLVYMCLAQRLGVSLEAVTPPGHIYLRYHTPEGSFRNIEPTARGIHLPCLAYQSIQEPGLETCSLKAMVGFALTNQAAAYIQNKEFGSAVLLYERGVKYLSHNVMMRALFAFAQILTPEKKEQGEKTLRNLPDEELPVDLQVLKEDWITGKLDLIGLGECFSLNFSNKQQLQKLEKLVWDLLTSYPESRSFMLAYGEIALQLHKKAVAYQWLKKYFSEVPYHSTVAYKLAWLAYEKLDYADAWHYLEQSVLLIKKYPAVPEGLKELYVLLQQQAPKTLPFVQEFLEGRVMQKKEGEGNHFKKKVAAFERNSGPGSLFEWILSGSREQCSL